jgi:hypothetical protein
VFAAAAQVGPGGSVTGVDVRPEQLAKSEPADKRGLSPRPRACYGGDGRLALAANVTDGRSPRAPRAEPTAGAACIAGASRTDLYLEDIAATGL